MGVLHWFGTQGGTRAYANPHGGASGVEASMSSVWSGEPKHFVQHDHGGGVGNYTDNKPNSWMAVYIGPAHLLEPDHYALRADYHDDGVYKLRHWVLEASVDGAAWEVLREHRDDRSCDKKMGVAAWALDAGVVRGRAFRHFRIRQTGKNSEADTGGGDYLCCSGIELYGRLRAAS